MPCLHLAWSAWGSQGLCCEQHWHCLFPSDCLPVIPSKKIAQGRGGLGPCSSPPQSLWNFALGRGSSEMAAMGWPSRPGGEDWGLGGAVGRGLPRMWAQPSLGHWLALSPLWQRPHAKQGPPHCPLSESAPDSSLHTHLLSTLPGPPDAGVNTPLFYRRGNQAWRGASLPAF